MQTTEVASIEAGGWRDFRRFWIAQGISEFGTGITVTVMPIIAVVFLHARPATLGFILAMAMLVGVILRPFAGWWADRSARLLPWLVAINLLLAGTSTLVPVLWLLDRLTLETLAAALVAHFALSSVAATLTVPAVPRLVATDQLLVANGRMQATTAASQVGGPAIAGLLLLLVSPPMALLADAASFLVCAIGTWALRAVERTAGPDLPSALGRSPEASIPRTPGLLATLRQRARLILYMVTLCACGGVGAALLPLFAIRVLDMSGATLSLLLALGALGGAVGGASVRRISALLSEKGLLIVAAAFGGVSYLALLLAHAGVLGAALVATYELLGGLAAVLAVTVAITEFQRFLPKRLMGRGLAIVGALCAAGTALGAAGGGIVAELAGQRASFSMALGLGLIAAGLLGSEGSWVPKGNPGVDGGKID